MQTLKASPSIVFQDAKGAISRDITVLTPTLVGLQSCEVNTPDGNIRRSLPTLENSILIRNAFKLEGAYQTDTGKVDLQFCFCVFPPSFIATFEFEGPRGCSIQVAGENPTKTSPVININKNGVYALDKALPHEKIYRINMAIKGYTIAEDTKKNFVRFKFTPNTTPIIASVGMALHNHEASMDCTLVMQDATTIRFHRAVLAARSAYFDKLFFGEFQESKTDGIPVLGSANAWQCIRSMMYKQMISTKINDALIDTLETVYQYDLDVFVQPVWETLQPTLDGFTAVRSLRLAGLHQHIPMGIDSMRFIQAHITTLICDCEWVSQYASVLQEIGGMPQAFVNAAI